MQTFKDKNGQSWTIDLPFGEALRIKAESGGEINILEPYEKVNGKELHERLYDDFELFYELLWYICRPVAREVYADAGRAAVAAAIQHAEQYPGAEPVRQAEVASEAIAAAFGKAMAGDCLVEAQTAFFAEWSDFCRGLNLPEAALVIEKMVNLRVGARKAIQKRISDSPEIQGLHERAMAKVELELNKSFGGLADSLKEILDDTPGDNSTT